MIDLEPLLSALTREEVEFVVIGGVAARAHGSAHLTDDIDLCYARHKINLERLVRAIAPFHPTLRLAARLNDAPGVPFLWDVQTLRNGLNFTLRTDVGEVDFLGEVAGVGGYTEMLPEAMDVHMFGVTCKVISLNQLIRAKKAANRPKDLLILPELESLAEIARQAGQTDRND